MNGKIHYFLIFVLAFLSPLPSALVQAWEGSIIATSDNHAVQPQTRIFGVASGATDGFDEELDVSAPPAPMESILLDVYFPVDSFPITRLSTDIKAEADTTYWILKVRADEDGYTLTWDISAIPAKYQIVMDRGDATIDMRSANSSHVGATGGAYQIFTLTVALLGDYIKSVYVTGSDVVVENLTVNASVLSNAVLAAVQHGELTNAPITSGETFGVGGANKRSGVVWEVAKLATGSNPSATATLTFSYAGIPGISDEGTLRLLKRDNATDTSWEDVTAGATLDTDANTFILNNQTSFGQYAIGAGDDNTLPVTFSSFTAGVEGNVITLRWRTETEVGNISFTIYRSESKDGPFLEIGRVRSAGSSGMPTDYQFIDETAQPGHTYFYYIEDVDIEGLRKKSKIIQITLPEKQPVVIPSQTALLQNYPNPFNPETWLPFQLAQNADVVIRIYDVRGRLVREIALGKKVAGIYHQKECAAYWDGKDARGGMVASGIYWYVLKASDERMGSFVATRRMVMVK